MRKNVIIVCKKPSTIFIAVVAAALMVAQACQEKTSSQPDGGRLAKDKTFGPQTRFSDAQRLSRSWCIQAQKEIAAFEGSQFDTDDIEQRETSSLTDLSNTTSAVEPASDRPVKIVSWLETMVNSVEPKGPSELAREAFCKMRSQCGIENLLDTEIAGKEGTCRQINEGAMKLALGALTEQERQRYESEGKKLVFGDDVMTNSGVDWYQTPSSFSTSGKTYTLSASTLLVPYDDYPELEDNVRGVHYCKLLPPSQMLFWLLHRAFWDDPLGSGPNQDEGAALISSESPQCEAENTQTPGSCIFYFPVADQHYCEEYTGPTWTVQSAEQRCAGRQEGTFSNSPCDEREDETSTLDGDGEYRGVCVINCGTPEEYRWHVYSEPQGFPLDQACSDHWFPAN